MKILHQIFYCALFLVILVILSPWMLRKDFGIMQDETEFPWNRVGMALADDSFATDR